VRAGWVRGSELGLRGRFATSCPPFASDPAAGAGATARRARGPSPAMLFSAT
jgi:hypothetical protein